MSWDSPLIRPIGDPRLGGLLHPAALTVVLLTGRLPVSLGPALSRGAYATEIMPTATRPRRCAYPPRNSFVGFLHVLPNGFMRIQHYGTEHLGACRAALAAGSAGFGWLNGTLPKHSASGTDGSRH
jgi:hypothetical protein